MCGPLELGDVLINSLMVILVLETMEINDHRQTDFVVLESRIGSWVSSEQGTMLEGILLENFKRLT